MTTPYMRQGDICLIPTSSRKPRGWLAVKRVDGAVVIAEGEVTGHRHRIPDADVELFAPGEASEMADRYLKVGKAGAVLVHEEHGPISLPAGGYIVRTQREYTPQDIRRVAD